MNDEIIRLLLDKMNETQKLITQQLGKVTEDHENRIRYIERWLWRAAGMSVIIAWLAGRVWR